MVARARLNQSTCTLATTHQSLPTIHHRTIHHILRNNNPEDDCDRLDRLAGQIVLELALNRRNKPTTHSPLHTIYQRWRAHPAQTIDINQLADELGWSTTHFRRQWKREFGTSPLQSLNELRLRQACRQLCEQPGSITSIAKQFGFDDPLYFSRCFRKLFQCSPQQYRTQHSLID